MSLTKLCCPECQTTLRTSQPLRAGKRVKCPRCGTSFAVPDVQATLDQDADQAARPVRRFPKESPAPTAAALDPTESARPVRRKRPKRKKKTATSSALWRWLASVVLLVLGIGVGVYAWKKGRHGEPGTLTSSSDVVHSKPDPVAQPEQEHLQGTQ